MGTAKLTAVGPGVPVAPVPVAFAAAVVPVAFAAAGAAVVAPAAASSAGRAWIELSVMLRATAIRSILKAVCIIFVYLL